MALVEHRFFRLNGHNFKMAIDMIATGRNFGHKTKKEEEDKTKNATFTGAFSKTAVSIDSNIRMARTWWGGL